MKVIIFAASIALVAVGCAEQRSAPRDPSSGTTSTTASASESYNNNPSATPSYSAKSSGTANPSTSTTTSTTTDPSIQNGQQGSAPRYGTWGSDTSSTTSSGTTATDRDGASVTANPGVADQTRSADNTKINDRDRHGALTPGDQGNSAAETKITAGIRKGLMASKKLSFTAKNVKVITTGTKVTLRGTVKSDEEKAEIESIAKSTQGVSEVDDQLEVKK